MMLAQLRYGLALADDIRRVRNGNVLPGAVIPLRTNIKDVMRALDRVAHTITMNATIPTQPIKTFVPGQNAITSRHKA